MEHFATEEQQVEAIKKFWKDNGAAIVIGAVLGLGGLWGWRYYSDAQRTAKEQASADYQVAVESIEADGNAGKLDSFLGKTESSGYATIGGLVAAQQAVSNNDYDTAVKALTAVKDQAADAHLATIASLRLARIQLEQGNGDAALSTLKAVNDSAFDGNVKEIEGDVYVAQEKYDAARMAYTEALEAASGNVLLEMKLDNLPVLASE